MAAWAQAGLIGDIQGVYNATNPFGIPAGNDGPAFVFQNTSGSALTNGVFTILAGNGVSSTDSFSVGTLAAGANFVLEVGVTSDGGSGHTFFAPNGVLDTSDVGPSGNNVQFLFTGLQNGLTISSGIFTPATSLFAANDGTIASMNFLGGPGNNDGPCNNCYGPHVIATFGTPIVPEPASWMLATLGLSGVLSCVRFARSRAWGQIDPTPSGL